MSLQELFDTIKYDEAAFFSVQRLSKGKYCFTIGKTLSTRFECTSIAEGLQAGVDLTKPFNKELDIIEARAEIVKSFARENGLEIRCDIISQIASREVPRRLICNVRVALGSCPPREIDPVCGWTEEEVKMTAISCLYSRVLQLKSSDPAGLDGFQTDSSSQSH